MRALLLLLALAVPCAARAQPVRQEPESPPLESLPLESLPLESLPLEVAATASTVSDGGTFTLRLACTPQAELGRRYSLRVALSSGPEDVLAVSEHVLEPRTERWEPGATVDLSFDLGLPAGRRFEPAELVDVHVGFVAEGRARALPPGGDHEGLANEDGLVWMLDVEVPDFAGAAGGERLRAALDEGDRLRLAGDTAGAWAALDDALRRAMDDATKERVRDALATVGRLEPPPQTEVEHQIARGRVAAEKLRVFRLEAGRLYDRGMLHAALRLLEEAGGALAEDADAVVLGALADAERDMQRVEDIEERLLTELTTEDAADVERLVAKHDRTEALLRAADKLAAEGRRPPALALYRKLRRVDGIELYDRAQERLEEVAATHLAATPPAEEEEVRAVREHPAWERTRVVPSHCFLFIGPERLVDGLPAESKLRFDLAYVLLTDLFGRRPNPDGDRVTVYFKELWDFGGGVGGGKIIDIGRADPDPPRPVRVDTGLLYHELTHCIDDTLPIHAGFREGLANLGAAYAHEALDQEADALHSFEANLDAFRTYYLERDLEYWRIQNYGPSAGLFLHFVETYSRGTRNAHDWSPLRRFFREYRWAPVRDGREPAVVRSLAHHLVLAFGPRAFDDLAAFRFPLVESDRRLVARELEAFEGGADLFEFEGRFADCPNSLLPRDAVQRELATAARRDERARAAELRAELGIVFDWKVIGPFFAKGADPGAHVFTPEREIDFAQKPRTWRASRADYTQLVWQDPAPAWVPQRSHRDVELGLSGWLRFDYQPYGDDDSAIYALTHVTVDEPVEALAHLRADDDFVLFVNDRRVGSYRARGTNGSTSAHAWRGPFERAPDAMRFGVRLERGRNRVLVKIKNRFGKAGLVVAFSRPDGSRLDFHADAQPPDVPGPRAPVAEPTWKRSASLDHRSLRSKTRTTVGGFRSRNKAVSGTSTDRGVAWRLFTVRPGFPKDSPSNLMWLKPSLTKDLDAVRVDVTFATDAAPKVLLTIQGEGGEDGLSGWNLILVPRGASAVQARLERYDRLVYQTEALELPAAPEDGRVLSLAYWDGWCSAEIDGVMLFERVSMHPIAGHDGVGLATWGPEPALRSIELSRGK